MGRAVYYTPPGAIVGKKVVNGTAGKHLLVGADGMLDQADVETGVSIGDDVTDATSGSVLFIDSSGNLAQDNANFFWDDTNNRLGIGTASPEASLHIEGDSGDTFWKYKIASNSHLAFSMVNRDPGDGRLLTEATWTLTSPHQFNINPFTFNFVSSGAFGANWEIFRVRDNGTTVFAVKESGAVDFIGAVSAGAGGYLSKSGSLQCTFGVPASGASAANVGGIFATGTQVFSTFWNGSVIGLHPKTHIGNTSAIAINSRLQVTSASATEINTVLKAAASQSADLLQIQNSSGTPLTYVEADGELVIAQDSKAIKFGAGVDATILYDGTNLVINPKLVGTGYVDVTDKLRTAGELEVDGDLNHDGTNVGFYGVAPVARATTGVAEATFVENSGGTAVNVDSTFGGYTLQQIAQALQNVGLLT